MSTLGERIRKLRNERKLTLVEVAGNQMTKGMLSLIENNKASPSMENLTYIAEQLGVPTADLLGNHIAQEEELLDRIQHILKNDRPFHKFAAEIWALYDAEHTLSDHVSGAQLAVYFGKSAYFMGKSIAPFFTHAEEVYKSLHAADLWINTVLERVKLLIKDQSYEEAIQFLTLKENDLHNLVIQPSPMSLLEWNFYLAAIQFSLGSYHKGMETIDKSMELSRKHHIYFMMNQLLRMGTAVEMLTSHKNYVGKYLNKLKQYMAFSEDEDLYVYVPYIETHYYTTYKLDIVKAEKLLARVNFKDVAEMYIPFLYLERGKILYYKNNYREAFDLFENVKFPESLYHPIDQSVLASRYTFIIKIAKEINDSKLMNKAIELGSQAYEPLPASFYKEQFFKLVQESSQENK